MNAAGAGRDSFFIQIIDAKDDDLTYARDLLAKYSRARDIKRHLRENMKFLNYAPRAKREEETT